MTGRKPLVLGNELKRREIQPNEGSQAFAFWPRTLSGALVVPAGHTFPTRDLVIEDGASITVEDGAEVYSI